MKYFALAVLVFAILGLGACWNDEEKVATDTVPVDNYGEQVEVRVLDKSIREALGLPDAAAVIVPSFRGKTVIFEDGEKARDVKFPLESEEILNAEALSLITYKGSTCILIKATWGYRRLICVP